MVQYISKCPCGDSICSDWHVNGVAAVQGVKFTRTQAAMVAKLLNDMRKPSEYSIWLRSTSGPEYDAGDNIFSMTGTMADACAVARAHLNFETDDKVIELVANTYTENIPENYVVDHDVIPRAAWFTAAGEISVAIGD